MENNQSHWPPRKLAWSWVVVMLLAYTCSFADRQILALMIGPIRADLHISDSEFGLLHGLSFAMLYCLLALPSGWLVDRYPRRSIIVGGILMWSIMTALCGVARNFWQLFVARIGVGVGEATLSPAVYSLLADCFPKDRLGRAMSIYLSGGPIGIGLALMVGGSLVGLLGSIGPVSLPVLGEIKSWQLIFFVVALPGLPVAALTWSLREPPPRGDKRIAPPSWGAVFSFIIARRSFMLPFFGAMACTITVMQATLTWAPAYLMRVYGKTAMEVGLPLGPLITVAMSVGLFGDAWLAERLSGSRGIQHAALRVATVSLALAVFAGFSLTVNNGFPVGLATVFLIMFLATGPSATVTAALQSLTPSAMLGRVSAIYLVSHNAIALVFGPLVPALITDHLFKDDKMVGVSLGLTIMAGCTGAAILYLTALRNLPGEAAAGKEPVLSGAAE